LGISGLPIFSGAASGLAVIFGPTGGYLVGFLCASWIIGYVLSRYQAASFAQIFLAMSLGLAIIFILGCTWLKILFKLDLYRTLTLGLLPFLPGAATKLLAASLLYQKIQKRTRQIF
jgi:biotin transport system substrate-specific component